MNLDKVFENCLCEMGRRVGLEWDTFEDVKEYEWQHGPHWYKTRSWTSAQQDDFAKWMDAYLRKSRRLIYRSTRLRKYDVGMFLLNYGWITNDDNNDDNA